MAEAVKAQVQQLEAKALQHADAVNALNRVAADIQEALGNLGLLPSELHGSETGPLLEFFAHTLGKLRLLPGLVEDMVREAADQRASSVGSMILPRVALLLPGFPFDRCFSRPEPEGSPAVLYLLQKGYLCTYNISSLAFRTLSL